MSELLSDDLVELEREQHATASVSEPPVRLELTTFALLSKSSSRDGLPLTLTAGYDQALLFLILLAHVPALPQVPAAPALLVALVIRALQALPSPCPPARDSYSPHGGPLVDEHSNKSPNVPDYQ